MNIKSGKAMRIKPTGGWSSVAALNAFVEAWHVLPVQEADRDVRPPHWKTASISPVPVSSAMRPGATALLFTRTPDGPSGAIEIFSTASPRACVPVTRAHHRRDDHESMSTTRRGGSQRYSPLIHRHRLAHQPLRCDVFTIRAYAFTMNSYAYTTHAYATRSHYASRNLTAFSPTNQSGRRRCIVPGVQYISSGLWE